MFEIKFELLDSEIRRLKEYKDIEDFELDMNEILGQVQLKVNEEVEGFVEKEVPYEGEFISEWLYLFNEAIKVIDVNGFVSLSIPDSNNIRYEIELQDVGLRISKIRAVPKQISKHICLRPVDKNEIFWSEIIEPELFYQGVIDATEQFLRLIGKINRELMKSRILCKINQSYLNAKAVKLLT